MKNLKTLVSSREKAWLLFVDVLLFIVSFVVISFLRWGDGRVLPLFGPPLFFVLLVTLVALYVVGSYDLDEESGWRSIAFKVGLALSAGALVAIALNYILGMERADLFGRGILFGAFACFGLMAMTIRRMLLPGVQRRRDRLSWLLLTTADNSESLHRELRENRLEGRLETLVLRPQMSEEEVEGALLAERRSGIILAAPTELWEQSLGPALVEARLQGQGIVNLSGIYERLWKRVPVRHLDHSWFFQSEGFGLVNSGRKQKIKRVCDLGLAFSFLFFLWPVMLLTALAIRLESSGAALYRQTRTGKGGLSFTILKFRSMRMDAEKDGAQWAKAKDDRITKVGKWIRLTRLDELPQLFNVLAGEMSFIGPRPERPEFNEDLAKQIPYYNLRHLVRPGLTGWAQISYPYGASVEDAQKKLEFDLFYMKHQSLFFDAKILLKTARVVLLAAGR